MSKNAAHKDKEGTHHWIAMKVTSAALVPLGIWFAYSVLSLAGSTRASALAWVTASPNATILLLFLGISLYHSAMGVQVIVEDYVHTPWRKKALLTVNNVLHVILGALALVSVMLIAVKG